MDSPRIGTKDDLPKVRATLAAAFFDDPIMTWVIPDAATRRAKLEVLLGSLAESEFLPVDGIYISADGASVALWLRPGVDREPRGGEAPVADEGPSPIMLALEPDELMRLGTLSTTMVEHHPKNEHWYLNVLGTDPAHQSKGLGGLVVAPVLAICDREGAPAYLESSNPRNIPFYRRLGFAQSGEIPLPDGPSLWPMWREPMG